MRNTSLRGGTTKQSPAITERPILFQTEMVNAILTGRKTQTRRTKSLSLNVEGKPKKNWIYTECFLGSHLKGNDAWMAMAKHIPTGGTYADNCPYGKPGDLLWVRETWAPALGDYAFKADYSESTLSEPRNKGLWKPSIHMPKDAARIWLMIEDIRVERVQEISEGDAEAEGAKPELLTHPNMMAQSFKLGFFYLWASINGEESLEQNPWVWVIQFRVLSKTGKPSDEVIEKNLCSSAVSKSEIRNHQSEIE